MTYDERNTILAKLYPVNTVARGYKYWVRTLTEKCLGMFTYTGLPETLPDYEIELRLIETGYCAVFEGKDHVTQKKIGLVTSYGGLSGIDMYYKPTKFVYAQPVLGSANLDIHKDVAVIYNNQLDSLTPLGLRELIQRYARMLADIDSSINIYTVNTRAMTMNIANNEKTAKALDEVMKKMRFGEYATINEGSILDCIRTIPTAPNTNNVLTELLVTRESMLKAFYREIGIKSSIEKKERMITNEVESDNQILLINQSDMLAFRKKGVAEINKLFNQKITVEIAEEYQPIDITEGEPNDD